MITKEEAIEAVEVFDCLTYFDKVSGPARLRIAEIIMAMVNWPPENVLRNAHNEVIPYVDPKDRLKWLVDAMTSGDYDEWPGLKELRGVYCSHFKAADLIEGQSSHPRYASSIDPVIQPTAKYLPQPGDEPIGDDIRGLIGSAAAKLSGGAK